VKLPVLRADELQGLARQFFLALGSPPEAADRVAASLVRSNIVGHDSHGVIRIVQYVKAVRSGRIDPRAEPEVEQEGQCTARVNGNWGWGQVAAWRAAQLAVAKARQAGIAGVALYRSNHVGRVGEYVEEIARHEMIGLAFANNHGGAVQVAPFGGRAARLSTNPIAFCAPTSGFPILVDITSSVAAEGKIRVLRNQGKQAPEGWLVDAEGNPTTDPGVLYTTPAGALLPLGGALGHKGYGLGVMVDVLAGALTGALCSHPEAKTVGNAMLILAIRIDAFAPKEHYYEEVDKLVSALKSCPSAKGFKEVLLPGEIERRVAEQRLAQGIEIDDETWREILQAAQELGIALPA